MANLLSRFKKQVVGSNRRIFDYLPKITSSGEFKRVKDIDVIINSWNNILLTPKRTYLNDPDYGSNLHLLLFEPVDENTVERIKEEIESSIGYYDDRARITDITVTLMPDYKGFSVNIFAEYEGEEGTLSVKFDDSTLLTQEGTSGASTI